MDVFLKGIVVQTLDQLLTEESLLSNIQIMRHLKPAVNSVEDAVFGHVIGELVGRMKTAIYSAFKREPTIKEIEIVAQAILRRSLEIKSEVRKYANL